jgi:tRNA threonylcarbamoyladenosine modification (KEOPS) complex  Pcc1 subunit
VQKKDDFMTDLTKKITITLICDSTQKAAIICKSLQPEINKEFQQTTMNLTQNNEKVTLTICAQQTNMLRAAFNSYMRWIETASSVIQQY